MKYAVVVLAALTLVLGIQVLGRADAPAGVQKWEYKVLLPTKRQYIKQPTREEVRDGVEGDLAPVGADGWEIVCESTQTEGGWILKRPAK